MADQLPDKVSLHRLPERQGLIKGRHRGAELATGEVLIFLDSHVEPCDDWSVVPAARLRVGPAGSSVMARVKDACFE